MTRLISMDRSGNGYLVNKESKGGEILVPKIPSAKITEICKGTDNTKHKITSEKAKIHESLISKDDGRIQFKLKIFLVLPDHKKLNLEKL